MNRSVLVTGGAGYIGSHACKALAADGFVPVALDNLSTGWRDAVQFGPLEVGDLRDRPWVEEVIRRHEPVAVLHFGALSDVAQASKSPGLYWDNNVIGTLRLVEAMTQTGVKALIFSSTCAVYGDQDGVLLDETSGQWPMNAYGGSKRAAEDLIRSFAQADGVDLDYVLFRYFNVAGADPQGQIGEFHVPETHLLPLALDAASGRRDVLSIFGQDYPTPDGTCVRDYVHVTDLVTAHLLGLRHLLAGGGSDVFNLGTGRGFSVRELVDAVTQVTGMQVPVVNAPRRPGDCAALVSGSAKAERVLEWQPRHSAIEEMVSTAWAWHQRAGYTE